MFRCLLLRLAVACGLLSLLLPPDLSAQTTPTAPWSHKVRSGDIVYFAFASPSRIERYDLSREEWLTPVSLTEAPNALHVDTDGIYYAVGRAVLQRALDGTNERPVYNTPESVTGILTDANTIFIFSPGYNTARASSVRKSDLQFVATWTGTYSLGTGFSISPTQNRIYGINNYTSSYSTLELPYYPGGTFGSVNGIDSDGSYGSNQRTWVSPDERRLIRSNGAVYSVPGISTRASLAGPAEDVAFHGADVAIVLRSGKLLAFDNAFLEAGSHTLPAGVFGIAVRSGQIYTFAAGPGTSGVAVAKIAVSALTAAQPGAALDPALLAYIPDDVQQTEDGSLLLYSKKHQSIFRWSPATRSYTASYPLLGTPTSFTYSPALRRIYTLYSSGAIHQIKLDQGGTTESPFYNLPNSPGPKIMAVDESIIAPQGSSYYSYVLINRDGQKQATLVNPSGYATLALWSASQRRLYYTDSFNSLNYVTLDTNGQTGTPATSYNRYENPLQAPLRLASDGGSILGINGYVYRTSDLAYNGALSNTVIDATSRAGNWVTIRVAGTATQLQLWTSAYFFERGFNLPGVPLRVFTLADGRLLALTTSAGDATGSTYNVPRNDGGLIFSLIDTTGAGTVNSSPHITTEPVAQTLYRGKTGSLSVTATGGSLTYQWRHNGADIPSATAATLSLPDVQDHHAGTYTVVVRNSYGSATSKPAAIVVQTPPPAPVITSQPYSATALIGGSASFAVSVSGTNVTYQWRRAGTPIAGATSSYFSLSSLTSAHFTTYDVVVSNPGGSVTSQTVSLNAVAAVAILTQPEHRSVALGATATFSVTASGSPAPSYRWFRQAAGTTSFVSLTGSSGGIYMGAATATLTITNATLAMNGDLFRCVVSNGYYTEVTSASATLSVSAAPLFTSATSTTFEAGVSNGFLVQASGTPAPQFTATGLPVWANLNPSGILSGTPPNGQGSPFTFQITASNGSPPNATQVFSIYVNSMPGVPVIVTPPASRSVAPGTDVTLSVSATGPAPLAYQWLKDGVAIAGADQSTYTLTAVALSAAGRYTVIVSNTAGSVTSRAAVLSVVPTGVTATHASLSQSYLPGQHITITNTITYPDTATGLGWQVVLPEGWSFVSSSVPAGTLQPETGSTSVLEWAWTTIPASPFTFSYTLAVPPDAQDDQALLAFVTLRLDGPEIQLLATPDPLVLRRRATHSADVNSDGRIGLSEIVRVIQLYNTRQITVRTGAYRVDAAGEDGFNPDPARTGTATLTAYHHADTNRDGLISLSELSRVIHLYSYREGTTLTGVYHPQAGTEDGFAPGP